MTLAIRRRMRARAPCSVWYICQPRSPSAAIISITIPAISPQRLYRTGDLARFHPFFARIFGDVDPGGVSFHLLLLSGCLL